VEQKVRSGLTTKFPHSIKPDYTKLWCGVSGGPVPEELEYQSTKLQIFQELDRQLGFQTPIPPDVLSDKLTILTPLTDGEQEEEREETLYTIPFVPNLDMETSSPTKQTLTKRKQQEKEAKGK
jgi:hypothetical protein